MKVMYVSSEAAPLVKIGGLGDVAGTLPIALNNLGIDVSVTLPHFGLIDNEKWAVVYDSEFSIPFNGKDEKITVSKTVLPGSTVPVILLGNETYIASGGKVVVGGQAQEIELYALFTKAVATFLTQPQYAVDIAHYNDWMTSLLPLLATSENTRYILTIHNLAYQGQTKSSIIDKLGANAEAFSLDPNGDVNFLKQGILGADYINTVSETYSHEIRTEAFGEGLHSLLTDKRLTGIMNGIDYTVWNPASDQHLSQTYSVESGKAEILEAKDVNKQTLQEQVHLPVTDSMPVIGFIGRIEPHQKGVDLLYDWLANDEDRMYQMVFLGTGDKEWEANLTELAKQYPDTISMNAMFSESLAHLMYGGCDYIVMPSKFEPGGLPQMIAQRYGTIPIVHAVGGLKDSVKDGWTGFSFADYTVDAMKAKINLALTVFGTDAYIQIAHAGMKQNYSWEASAKKYVDLYHTTLKG